LILRSILMLILSILSSAMKSISLMMSHNSQQSNLKAIENGPNLWNQHSKDTFWMISMFSKDKMHLLSTTRLFLIFSWQNNPKTSMRFKPLRSTLTRMVVGSWMKFAKYLKLYTRHLWGQVAPSSENTWKALLELQLVHHIQTRS